MENSKEKKNVFKDFLTQNLHAEIICPQCYLCAFKPPCWMILSCSKLAKFHISGSFYNHYLYTHPLSLNSKNAKHFPLVHFTSSLLSELSGGLRMVFWQRCWNISMCWHTLHQRKVSGWRWGWMTVWGWNGCSCVKLVLVSGIAARCFLQLSH